jgi:hypothetical protein
LAQHRHGLEQKLIKGLRLGATISLAVDCGKVRFHGGLKFSLAFQFVVRSAIPADGKRERPCRTKNVLDHQLIGWQPGL